MTQPQPDAVVHQVHIGFRHGDGMTVLAGSPRQVAERRRYAGLLESHARLYTSPDPAEREPEHALSYVRLSRSEAAVVRRWRGVDPTDGRNPAHVLIGDSRVLTADAASALGGWSGWRDEPGDDPPTVSAAALYEEASAGIAALRAAVLADPSALRLLLAGLCDRPAAALSVFGVPDHDRLALLWALRHTGPQVLPERAHRMWTFSTYEIDRGAGQRDAARIGLLETVFVVGPAQGPLVDSRTVVDVRRPQPASTGATAQVDDVVARFVAEQAHRAGGRDTRRPSPAPPAAERSRFRGFPPLTRPAPVDTTAGGTPPAWLPDRAKPHTTDADGAGTPERARAKASPLRGRGAQLVHSVDATELEERLAVLERRGLDTAGRCRLRAELGVAGFEAVARRAVELCDDRADRVLDRLVKVTFGPSGMDDLGRPVPEVSEHVEGDADRIAVGIVATTTSVPLLSAMFAAADRGDRTALLLVPAGRRWCADHAVEVGAGGPGTPAEALTTVRARLPLPLRRLRPATLLGGAAAGLVALGALFGLVVAPLVASPATETTTRGPSPSLTAPVEFAGAADGLATAEVYLLVRPASGTGAYRVADRCTVTEQWRCRAPATIREGGPVELVVVAATEPTEVARLTAALGRPAELADPPGRVLLTTAV